MEVPLCTLRELLLEKTESPEYLGKDELPPLIARFRGSKPMFTMFMQLGG